MCTLLVDPYSAEIVLTYTSVSAYISMLHGHQDANGAVLVHIKDLSQMHAVSIGVPVYMTDEQVFHTDTGDIIVLLALQTAAAGSLSCISSSYGVYNELGETQPNFIKTLSKPVPPTHK